MNAIIFGAGNIGSVLAKSLVKEGLVIKYIIRTSGIFDSNSNEIAQQGEWKKYIDDADMAFVCIPTVGTGEQALEYELAFLEQNKPVITCEKASVAHHWNDLREYKNIFKYTASVGAGTRMLNEISRSKPESIKELKVVVNGTLNYISSELKSGKSKDEIVKEVLEKGYAEPGATKFEDIIKGEMDDVTLKTVIIANHSGIFNKTIATQDIKIVDFDETKRCIVLIKNEGMQVGFIEDNDAEWLSSGVNNVLYLNGEKRADGPGAGAEATVSSMIADYREMLSAQEGSLSHG